MLIGFFIIKGKIKRNQNISDDETTYTLHSNSGVRRRFVITHTMFGIRRRIENTIAPYLFLVSFGSLILSGKAGVNSVPFISLGLMTGVSQRAHFFVPALSSTPQFTQ